jgi:hydrogenase nickel incorporation protein HypA/HybF
MHELRLASAVVDACVARAEGARVTRVRLEIGSLSAVLPDAIRFCFDACARDTIVEGAELEIIEIAGQAICRDCRSLLTLRSLFDLCSCGSAYLDVVAGEQLRVKEMEVV